MPKAKITLHCLGCGFVCAEKSTVEKFLSIKIVEKYVYTYFFVSFHFEKVLEITPSGNHKSVQKLPAEQKCYYFCRGKKCVIEVL